MAKARQPQHTTPADRPEDIPFREPISSAGGKSVARYVDTAMILAIATAIAYYLGWIYFDAYAARLAIPSELIQQPADAYIRRAVMPIAVFDAIFVGAWLAATRGRRTHFKSFLANTPLYLGALILGTGMPNSTAEGTYAREFYAWAILGGAAALTLRRTSVIDLFITAGPRLKAFFLAAALVSAVPLASLLGRLHAEARVAGDSYDASVVEFSTAHASIRALNTREPILVLATSDRYYVVPRQTPLPRVVKTYVVRADQVDTVTLRSVR